MKIPFSQPDISELEINEVADVLRSGWITTGSRTKEFEKRIAEYIGTEKCVCLNSQTACAEMTLRILGVGEGDEVITSAYTYTATAAVICHVGATPVLIDTQKNSYEMDYEALEAVITEKTKVIIPVDLGGVPCDYDKIFEIVDRKKGLFKPLNKIQATFGRIIVLADTAHAFGAKLCGKMIGSIADFSCFSFHAVKNLTTAEGGAVTWRNIPEIKNDELYKKYMLLSLHGQNKDAYSKSQLGAWEYDIEGTYYKCNMTDIAAAVGLKQLERYQKMLTKRKEIIRKYDEAFRPLGVETLAHYTDMYSSSGHLYLTRIPNISAVQRNEIIEKMAGNSIACNVHYKPLPMLTAYKKLGFDIKNFPNAYARFANEITLPLHTCLTDEMVSYVIEKYLAVVKEYI